MSRRVWVSFALLCLLAGSTWVAANAFASTWPALLRLGFHDGMACLVLLAAGMWGRRPVAWNWLLAVMGWSAIVFGVPEVLFAGAAGSVGSSTELLVFGLAPFFTVFIDAQRKGGELRMLVPALVGLGGLALIVPFAFPGSTVGLAWFAGILGVAGLAAWAGIKLHPILHGVPLVWAAAAASGAAATVAIAGWIVFPHESFAWDWKIAGLECGWGVGIDLPLLLLAVWLFKEMKPVAFSTRFFLVPLVTIAGGMIAIRPRVEWTTWLGLMLMAVSGWMLMHDDPEQGSRSFETL